MSLVGMINYGFVVLNYVNYQDTIECVSSLLAIKRNDYTIIVVDNYSQNESMDELQKYFDGNKTVYFVRAPANLGYSGGNNLGIKWLRDRSIVKIIVATNDTVLISEDILDTFDALDLQDVGVVGPSIVSLDGDLQNPTLLAPDFLYFANLFFYRPMKLLRNTVYKLFPDIELRRGRSLANQKLTIVDEGAASVISQPVNVYMLHGAFLYLTSKFIDKIGMLDDNIFMYGEEDLLSWQCEQSGLSRLFTPGVSVLHKERKSAELVHKDEKAGFIESNVIKSRNYVNDKIGVFHFLFFLLKLKAAK